MGWQNIMDIQELYDFCHSLPEVTSDFPFDETTLCLRIFGKIFALVDIEARPISINLKCEPNLAVELREKYNSILPGYHMNKKHWNTIIIDGSISKYGIENLILHSYSLVYMSLSNKEKAKITDKSPEIERIIAEKAYITLLDIR